MRICQLLFFTVVLAASSGSAGAARGTLRGVVRDAAGAVLPGAVIFIQHWKLNNHSLNHPVPVMEPIVHADSKGQFSIELPPDFYDVFVAYPTFAPYAKRVKIEPRKEVVVECELPFDPLTRWVE